MTGKREKLSPEPINICVITAVFLFMVILIQPFTAMSFDKNLIENELLWQDKCKTNLISAGELEGKVSYITDNENGCFYIHFHFLIIGLIP